MRAKNKQTSEKMRLYRRRLKWPLFAIMVGAIMWLRPSKPTPMPPVEGITFEEHYIDSIELYGRLGPKDEAFLGVRNGGRLDQVKVQVGAHVEAGTTIAIVDQTARTAALQQALSQFRLASSESNRVQRLHRLGSSTLQELEQAQTTFHVRRAELQTAKQNLEDAMIRAPFAGVVSFIAFQVGDIVPEGSRVAVIENQEAWRLVTKVSFEKAAAALSATHAQVAIYDPVGHQVQSAWQKASIQVRKLNASSNYDGGYSDLEVMFPQPVTGLKVGDSVAVKVILAEYDRVAFIPPSALYRHNQQNVVLTRREDGEYEFLVVKLVKISGGLAVISELPAHSVLFAPPPGKDWRQVIAKLPILQDVPKSDTKRG